MKWMVAPSYQKAEIRKVDENAKKAYIVEACDRCGGSGFFAPFGTCFKCNGAGKIGKWVKAYTEEEYEKYLATQERAKERKEEARQARLNDLLNNSEENKKALLVKFGYDPENPCVYIVMGEDTYAIKDELKSAGARFERALGWYFNQETEVPEGYTLAAIPFDDVFDWNPYTKQITIKETAEAAVNALKPKSDSEYIGSIKERVRDLCVTCTGDREVDGYYGLSHVYTFKSDKNVLVWITTSCQDISVGDEVLLTGTVKEHSEYNGVKQTKLTRCVIKREAV